MLPCTAIRNRKRQIESKKKIKIKKEEIKKEIIFRISRQVEPGADELARLHQDQVVQETPC